MKIARDKWKHFFVGIPMGAVLLAAALLFFKSENIALWLSGAGVVAISYGFELYSKFTGHGHYEVMDAVAAIIGGAIGMFVTFLMMA